MLCRAGQPVHREPREPAPLSCCVLFVCYLISRRITHISCLPLTRELRGRVFAFSPDEHRSLESFSPAAVALSSNISPRGQPACLLLSLCALPRRLASETSDGPAILLAVSALDTRRNVHEKNASSRAGLHASMQPTPPCPCSCCPYAIENLLLPFWGS